MSDDKAGDKFCEEDIEEILQGRTSVVQIDSVGTGSTFAKVRINYSTSEMIAMSNIC